nr:beta-galactosidase 13-like [Ipomoea batatas]
MGTASCVLVVGLVWMLVASTVVGNHGKKVTYDGRSLIIGGTREVFFSGSIHYPRMPPEVYLYLYLSICVRIPAGYIIYVCN